MNDEEFKQMNDAVVGVKEKLPVGRPLKKDSGSMVQPCSAPMMWRGIMEKYKISPSEAFQQGVLMLLNMRDDFPQTPYEEILIKGAFVEKRQQFAKILSERL